MNNDKLIEELSKLKLEEASLKRNLDVKYCDKKTRTFLFNRIKEIKKEIEKVNFKLRVERKMNNEERKNNTSH